MYKKTLLSSALAFAMMAPPVMDIAQAAPSATPAQAAEDSVITAKIKLLYAKSSLVKGSKVHVTTNNRNVTLSGVLNTKSQYERAVTLADSVDGVNSVHADELKVKASDAPLTDAYLTAKVKGAYLKEQLFGSKAIDSWPVKVETKDAVVYLSGKTRTLSERNHLIKLAQTIDGVKSVDSALTVK